MRRIFTLCLLAFLGVATVNAQAPTITSFTPLTAKPGDAVTLTGTGFNTTAANNIVFCGATKATVTAASATSVTITVPAGATFDYITLLNTGSELATNSNVKFVPTFSPAKTTIATTDFDTKVSFATNPYSYKAVIADIDGDGKSDIIVSTRGLTTAVGNTISVYRNISIPGSISTNSFAAKVDFTVGNGPVGIAVGDLDGDGKPDLAISNTIIAGGTDPGGTISILRNTSTIGNISFASNVLISVAITTSLGYGGLAIADLDGDGKLDVAVGCLRKVALLRNTSSIGNISFDVPLDIYTTLPFNSVAGLAIGDFNVDGKPEIVVLDAVSTLGHVYLFTNSSSIGSLNFTRSEVGNFFVNNGIQSFASNTFLGVGDVDNNGTQDILFTPILSAGTPSQQFSVFRNPSNTGTFSAKLNLSVNVRGIVLGDFDGDGKIDIAASTTAASVLRNNYSSGTYTTSNSFAARVDIPNTTAASDNVLAVGDLDGDGRPDIVTSNINANTIAIIRSAGSYCAPTSSTFTVAACGSYTWAAKGNAVYTASNNTDTIHLTNAGGCDSLVTLNLTINTATSSTTNINICPSQLPYSWNGSRTAAGTYTYTTTNSQGCDSVATLNLTLKTNYTITASAGSNGSISNAGATTICEGDNSATYTITANTGYHITDVLVDGISQGAITTYSFSNVTANHTIAASFALSCTPTTSSNTFSNCGSYMWNGQLYMSSGTYTYHTTNAAGCDSTATLNLTINYASVSTYAYDTICSSQLPYTWLGKTFNAPGSQPLFLQNAKGCDSVVTLVLAVKQTTSSTTNLSVYAIQLPYSWNGLTFATAGTQTAHLTNAADCDSAATLVLSIAPPACVPTASSTSASICSNLLPYSWNGLTFTTAGTQTAHLTNAGGCDSAATLVLTTKSSPIVASITNSVGTSISTAGLCTLGATYKYYNNTSYGVWSSSNAIVASVTGGSQAGVVTANNNGTTIISYTVTNSIGCSASANLQVTVAVQSTPNAITGLSKVCAGATITLSNTTTNGLWSCSQSSQAIVNATSGLVSGNSAGNAIINYTVTNTSGCNAVVSKTITVNALPAVPTITYSAASAANRSQFTYGGSFCVSKTCTVVGIPAGGNWAYTNPLVGTITSGGLVSFIGIGNGAIVYTYTDANGCKNSRTMPGTVANCPIPKGTINNVQLAVSNDFTMYPNPARSFISLNVESLVGAGSIVVTDLYGKAVKTQALSLGTNNVDIANLSKGFYLVSIITSEGKTTKKLVVE